MNEHLYIGLMSGTSLDGVDGVLADLSDPHAPRLLASAYQPFAAELRAAALALQQPGDNEIEREAWLTRELAHVYAACVAALRHSAPGLAIRALGAHGQTIRHRPELGFTRQSNQPALLAELTGIDVVADFRSRDVAAGGQGAPLVPAFHRAVFGADGVCRVVANIGGIANISILHADGRTSGFDTGPGNVLMDAWIMQQRGLAYDAGGTWAGTGHVHAGLLEHLLAEPYLRAPPPKSTGRDLFSPAWLQTQLQAFAALAPADVQATLCAYTAATLADAIAGHAPGAEAVYVCGGGAANVQLMRLLEQRLHPAGTTVDSSAALGVAPQHVEALAFAWLAQRFCLRQPGNLPDVTGARGLRVLGALYPA